MAEEDRDHLTTETHDSDRCPLVAGAVRPAQLARLHVVTSQAGGGSTDQPFPKLLRISLGQEHNGISPADPLVHRHLDHGIAEYPKQIVASGVVLAKLTFGGGHHGPVKTGDRSIGVRAEG